MTVRPFADTVLAYAQAGWPCIMPVPVEKHPPPVGFTGADGRDTDPMQLALWAGSHGDWSIALRMPDGVIGIDVDQYVKGTVNKQGGDTLLEAVKRWGELPATWSSTARGHGSPSRILFFRAPAQRYATKLGPDVEVIQRHHRYAVVWPSLHPDAAGIYTWYDPAGRPSDQPPKPLELAELPAAWVAGLAEGATEQAPASADLSSGQVLLAELLDDERPACAELASAVLTARAELTKADAGSRHDTATARVHHLVQLAAAGHPGLGRAIPDLAYLWSELTAGEDRGEEWERMLLTSARKAVTVVGPRQVANDPCLLIGTIPIAAPAPDLGAEPAEPIEPPRALHPLEVIGTQLFDPPGFLDQTLAQAVLERTYPVLRYAHDANTWLLRGPETWARQKDLAEWSVALLAELMPHGDPDADKGTDAKDQADRRKRFMSAAPSGAIAKKARALVAGGVHPCALKITDLDREPWLLWAGGRAFDLRASTTEPTLALIDPATPHLHSAGVLPERRSTPLWDAFTAAVWPDEELRGWALRVLAIAFTGYSDKALPILIGERDRGKTQIVALLMSVLGSYAHAADPRLLGGVDNAHASIVYALMGRRLSFIDEGPREGRLGQERLKQLTGGGELTGNRMNENPVTFKPTHTLVLTANDEPLLTDPAVRARARLIPCEGDPAEVIAARAAIGHPSDPAWRAEAPGVLAALMAEAGHWLRNRRSALTEAAPDAYRYRGEEIAAEQDPINNWLSDETEPTGHDDGTRSRTLYEAFVAWARSGNMLASQIPSETKWGRELGRRDHPILKRRDGNYRPLRLRTHGGYGPWTVPQPSAAAASPVELATTADGGLPPISGQSAEGSRDNPPHAENPGFSEETPSEIDLVEGVEGSNSSYAHAPAHTHAHGAQGENPAKPATPSTSILSADITARLLEAKAAATVSHINPPPAALPEGVIACTRGGAQPTAGDLAAVAEFAQQLRTAEPPTLHETALETLPPDPATATGALSGPERLRLEFHQLKEQQDRRVETATRGVLTDKRGRPSEEVLRYFGEGEFEGSGVEPRLTWTLFLEQRRPEREYEKTQQAAWEAGARLGRKHAIKTVPDADADFARAEKNHDPEMFAAGYTAGITEHDRKIHDAAGTVHQLPAVVTRDGTVRPIDQANVPALLAALGGTAELTVDVEHTGYPIGHPDYQLRTIQIGTEQVAIVYDAADPTQREQAKQLLADAAILHAHSATADLVPLADAGVILDLDEAWARMHDTVIPALLADPNSTGSDADALKELARDMLHDQATSPAANEARAALFKAGKWLTNTTALTPTSRSGWAQVDPHCETMIRYAASDVLDAAAIANRLPAVPPHVLQRERTAQAMTARVAHRGLRIDGEQVAALLPKHAAARADAAERMRRFGIENPGSDQQVAAALVKMGAPLTTTKTGRPSVARGVIEPLARIDGPIGELVTARLEYQHHDTQLTLFLEPYELLVRHGDGRARPTVYTLGADTGRMSCVRPNLQQVPRQGGMRACITADPGQLLVSADFASVEIRVAAALSGDRNLQHMLATGVDLHWEIARQVFGPDATKADRYNVKRGVFGRLYGGGIPTLARQVGISETTAAAMVDTLDAITPELANWSRAIRDAVKAGHTQFPTYSGRVIHLPAQFPHKGPNYCIQGTARELLVDTFMRWRDTTWSTATLLPVHDEIVLAIAADEADAATAQLIACMETELHGVRIAAEASTPSFSWQDAA